MPLYQQDLDDALAKGCQTPGCDHAHGPIEELWLHARCHPSASLEACYRDGILFTLCAVCRQPVVFIHVAKKP